MLYEPSRHEPLSGDPWNTEAVRAAVREIALDAQHARAGDGSWPLHPLDEEGDMPRGGYKGLYLGRAGVLWSLATLQRAGAIELPASIDLRAAIEQAEADYRADPDSGQVVPSYFLGAVGIQLVRWRLTDDAAMADRLHDAVRSNLDNPTNEALWGASGTMLAAWHLWRATGQARWRVLFLDNVESLWRTWQFDAPSGCWLWTQDMYGSQVQYLGAGHGFAGNVSPLLLGASLLDEARREALYERCEATLVAMARRDGDAVNWPPGTWTARPGAPALLMQWCHGAPGIVTALAHFPPQRSAAVDALLIAAGHAIWQAGPLAKGPGLCHGTAGNGLAFLVLHRRTGDATWLARARAFAMHAVLQRDRALQQYGQGRYTLWTGDLGLALVLQQCLDGTPGVPSLDNF